MRINRRKFATNGLIILLFAAFAGVSGGGLSKAEADALYCSIPTANCLTNYCNSTGNIAIINGQDNCNQAVSGAGYCPDNLLAAFTFPEYVCLANQYTSTHTTSDNSTKRTLSSSTFTTYTKVNAADAVPVPFSASSIFRVFCVASAQIQSSNLLAVIDFKVKDTVYSKEGPTWRVNTLVANDNFTISYATYPPYPPPTNSMVGASNSVYALQFSITGIGSVTVYHAALDCYEVETVIGSPVG